MKHDEAILQQQVVSQLRDWGCILFAVPNERNAGVADAVRMRATGLTKGAPDLICWTRNGKCWWLELKTPKGKRSPEQECFEELAHKLHIEYRLVRSLDDIKDIEYWSGPVI